MARLASRSSILGFAAALSLAAGGAAASGGGGGGGGSGGGGSVPSDSGPHYSVTEEYQKGQAAFDAGKYKDAATAFGHVSEAQPKVAAGWYMLGLSRSRAGDFKAGAGALAKSLKLEPDDVDTRREYALDLAKLRQTDKAKAELETLKTRATACANTCTDAAALKGAVSALEQALAAPGPAARLESAPGLLLAGKSEGDLAYVRAVSLINERRYDEALSALQAAERVFGPHPDVLTYEGYTWRKLGQLDRAEGYYKAALAVAPNHRGASEYYGELKVIRGDLVGARALLTNIEAGCAFACVEAEELRRWIDHGGDPSL